MYSGSLPTISNRADWQFEIGIVDVDTGEAVDLTGCTVDIALRDDKGCIVLCGDSTDKITFPEIGVLQVWFTTQDVHNLCAGAYDAGITITGNDLTMPLFSGSVTVVNGVVR